MDLTPAQKNRAAGVLLGVGVGDALGVPFEFQPPQNFTSDRLPLTMPGGGPFKFEPGEFSDDTQMTLCVARAAFEGLDLGSPAGLERVATAFKGWQRSGPKDMGGQVSAVLGGTVKGRGQLWTTMSGVSAARYAKQPTSSAGNGSLMRTAPVALRHLADPDRMTYAAQRVSALTHTDPDCLEACIIWCHIIRRAVLDRDARAGLEDGVDAVLQASGDRARAYNWESLFREAEVCYPTEFPENGWVIHAIQAAWSAVTLGLEHEDFEQGITAAVGCGRDTDTVAAIAGAVLGAVFGAGGMRQEWVNEVHGWPRVNGWDLARIGLEIAEKA